MSDDGSGLRVLPRDGYFKSLWLDESDSTLYSNVPWDFKVRRVDSPAMMLKITWASPYILELSVLIIHFIPSHM